MSLRAELAAGVEPSETLEAMAIRLREALALLEVIDQGGLLAELSPDRAAARRQQQAVSLLAVLRRDLEALSGDLQSAVAVQALMERMRRTGRGGDPEAAARSGG